MRQTNVHKIVGITAVFALVVIVILLVVSGGFSSHPKVNPQCTPQAAASLNAYWQNQVENATYEDLQTILANAEAATAQRIKECGSGS